MPTIVLLWQCLLAIIKGIWRVRKAKLSQMLCINRIHAVLIRFKWIDTLDTGKYCLMIDLHSSIMHRELACDEQPDRWTLGYSMYCFMWMKCNDCIHVVRKKLFQQFLNFRILEKNLHPNCGYYQKLAHYTKIFRNSWLLLSSKKVMNNSTSKVG